MPLSQSQIQTILQNEHIVEFEKDIRTFSKKTLRKHFSSRTGRIVLTRLIKSVIWQVYQRILSGDEQKIFGNIRTFWYRYLKVIITKIPKRDLEKTDPYDVMTKIFSEMVFDLRLFRYKDFDFSDENWENRRIGQTKPHVLVFAEKAGWMRYLRQVHSKYGVSTLALGGFPSSLTSEYTSIDIKKAIPQDQKIQLIGIVDFDPSGQLIAQSFRHQLELAGLQIESLQTIISPKHYTDKELDLYQYRLPRKQRTKLARWLEQTNGVRGKAYGLESESMPLERLNDILKNLLIF